MFHIMFSDFYSFAAKTVYILHKYCKKKAIVLISEVSSKLNNEQMEDIFFLFNRIR